MAVGPRVGQHLGLDKSSITGLVARTVSEIDRRVVRVSITDAERGLVQQVSGRFTEWIEDLVAALTDTDQQHLSRLASRIVIADMHRHGLDPGSASR